MIGEFWKWSPSRMIRCNGSSPVEVGLWRAKGMKVSISVI